MSSANPEVRTFVGFLAKLRWYTGIRLLSDEDFLKATYVVPEVCHNFTLTPGETFLVSRRGIRVLENAFQKGDIRAERVMVEFTKDHTTIIYTKNKQNFADGTLEYIGPGFILRYTPSWQTLISR